MPDCFLLLGWRPSQLGWRPSQLGWRPSLLATNGRCQALVYFEHLCQEELCQFFNAAWFASVGKDVLELEPELEHSQPCVSCTRVMLPCLYSSPLAATSNKKLLGAKGIATRSKDATRGSWPCFEPARSRSWRRFTCAPMQWPKYFWNVWRASDTRAKSSKS